MRNFLLAAAAVVIATPALAQTGGYVGIEGGVLFPKRQNGNYTSTFTQTAQSPAAGTVAPVPGTGLVGTIPTGLATAPVAITGGSRVRYKRGYDVDAIAGYDFGLFRLEGELGYKRSRIKSFDQDATFATGVNTGLNPAGTAGTAFVFPTGDTSAFNLSNRVSVLSGMVNALLDIGGGTGPGVYAGGGFGRARVKAFRARDDAWAYQGIAGVRVPISSNVDIGLKYRYFRTGRLDLDPGSASFTSTRTVAVPNLPGLGSVPFGRGATDVAFTRTANVAGAFGNRFSSHSLLLSLAFNFGAAAEAVLPPPPPAPPPPPPPATQTCPDGSVILATDVCPAPPRPPPPPPPAPERG